MLTPIADVQAVKPGLNGKIAFDSNRDGPVSNSEVYVMNNDGSGATRLTNNPAQDANPSWSPDPTATARIAFESSRDSNNEIYTMRADGTNQMNITNNPASDSGAAWSPDGAKIAFTTNRNDNTNFEIYTMNADGTFVTRLTNNAASDVQATWSPDGAKIAFSTNRDGNYEIYKMNADGTNQVNVTNAAGRDQMPTWSPDGTKIIFVSDRDGNNEIYSMNTDGSSQTRLTTNASNDREPVWSPDGNKLALSSNAAVNFEVYAANSDGSGTPTNLTNNANTDSNPDIQTEQAPDTTITSMPANLTNSTSATFGFGSSETGSTFECRIDGGAGGGYVNCASPKTYSGLSDGPHTVDIRATDGASNTDPTPASYTWTVDTAAPQTTIDSGPVNLTNSTSATFSFSSNESGSTFVCRIDGGAYENCVSPKTYSSLGDGSHTVDIRATDAASNADSTPASHTWTVDTTAPQTTITSGPAHNASTTSARFEFTSTEPSSTFQCRLNAGDWASCDSPATIVVGSDGSFAYEVRAVDQAGNPDSTPASYGWSVDTAIPETFIDSGPAEHARSISATFTFHASKSNVAFECSLDGEEFAPCSSPETVNALVPGEHSFQVRTTDRSGNVDGTPATRIWTVDRRAPSVNAGIAGRTTGRHNVKTFRRTSLREVSGTAADEDGIRQVKMALRISSLTAAADDDCRFVSLYTGHRIKHPCKKPYTRVQGTTSWSLPLRHRVVARLRTDEQYVIMVRVTDLAGNKSYRRLRFAVSDAA